MPDSPEAWRCFVAVPVPGALRAGLSTAVERWKAEPGALDLRWTDPDGWHVTLAFLGPTDPGEANHLGERLAAAVRSTTPFVVSTGMLGAFPRPGAARSVWLGISDPDGHLGELATAVQTAVLPPDRRRPLRPHLTIGRSRARQGEPIGPWLASRTIPATDLQVVDVVLFRSHLGRGPARYTELARLDLGGAGSGRD